MLLSRFVVDLMSGHQSNQCVWTVSGCLATATVRILVVQGSYGLARELHLMRMVAADGGRGGGQGRGGRSWFSITHSGHAR